jgi:hypothetical protein
MSLREPQGKHGLDLYVRVTSRQAVLCGCALIASMGFADWRAAVPWWGRIATWLLVACALAANALFWAGRAANLERLDIHVSPVIRGALSPLLALWLLLAAGLDLAWTAGVQALHDGTARMALAACGAGSCAAATRVWWLALTARRRHARRHARAARALETLRGRAEPAELGRIERWLAWQQGMDGPPVAIRGDYFPGLGDEPWHEPGELARLGDLEQRHPAVRREVLHLYESGEIAFQRLDRRAPGADQGSALPLYRAGARLDDACARCPETSEVVARLTDGLARNAFVAVVPPHRTTGVRQHRDNHFLTLYWGIALPDRCELRVGSEPRSWQGRQAFLIDGSHPHEICNLDNEPQILLVIDIAHPRLTPVEQEFFRALAEAGIDA